MNKQTINISYDAYRESCLKLFFLLEKDILTLREDRKKVVILIGLDQGGRIPTILLDAYLSSKYQSSSYQGQSVFVKSTVVDVGLENSNLSSTLEQINTYVADTLKSTLDSRSEDDEELNFKLYFISDILDPDNSINSVDFSSSYSSFFWSHYTKYFYLYSRQSLDNTQSNIHVVNQDEISSDSLFWYDSPCRNI